MLRYLLGAVSLPIAIAHEATHAVLLWPWTKRWGWDISLDATQGAAWYVDLDDNIPAWANVLGFLGPTILGTLMILGVTLAWVVADFAELPGTVIGWVKLAIAITAWGVYATPSPDDIKEALS